MAMNPVQLRDKLSGTLGDGSIQHSKGGGENKTFPSVIKETPTDLAPGLRPRPHPAVPTAHGDFKGVPPPPPPPGDAPILNIEREVFKLPPRAPRDSNAPPTKPKLPPQVAMLDELKERLGRKTPLNRFEEPKREPPRRSPTLLDEMRAEMPDKIARLKPIGNTGSVSRMKEDIERSKLREDEHKKAGLAIASPWTKPAKPKEPAKLAPIVESPKKPDAERMGPTPKPPGRVEATVKIEQPVTEPQNAVEIKTVVTDTHLELPQPDPYILWPIRVLGISLILLGLLKLEIYLWVVSWNIHIWNRLYV
ncbi:hypothetical protein TWF506_010968 [Arthrobotrys conoides]|uniref:Uncharacterized protein n=1 Tax=Arthrobotrys conoides TaxID=74498 RepID=A0AAN8RK62_9PEZI